MNQNTEDALRYICACYPIFKLTDAVAMAWGDQLDRFPRDVLLKAVREVCATHAHGTPSPAHLAGALQISVG